MSEELTRVGDVEIAYDTIGDPADPPLLLVMGLGMQLIHWDRELCELLAGRGFRVIRFDNRDAGRSTQIDAPVPNLARAMAGLRIEAPYLLDDMADDAFGLLDHLGHRGRPRGGSVDGRDDRPDDGDPQPRARALAGFDHVDHGRAARRPPQAARVERADAPGPHGEGRLRGALRARVPHDRLERLSRRRCAHP